MSALACLPFCTSPHPVTVAMVPGAGEKEGRQTGRMWRWREKGTGASSSRRA